MEAVAVEKPPVSDRSVSVISHDLHSNAGDRAVNLHGAGDISKLLVVVLVGGLQPGEVLSAPGLPGHGPGHRPGRHLRVEVEVWRGGGVASIYPHLGT